VTTPAPPKLAFIQTIDKDPFVQKAVRDVNLSIVFLYVKRANSARQYVRLLIILLHLVGRHFWPAPTKISHKFAIFVVLDDAVTRIRSRQPHVFITINEHRLKSARPARTVVGPTPTLKNLPFLIEFDYFRTEHTAFLSRRKREKR